MGTSEFRETAVSGRKCRFSPGVGSARGFSLHPGGGVLSQFCCTVDHKAIYREQNEVFSTILHEAAKHPIPFLLGQKPEQAQEELF